MDEPGQGDRPVVKLGPAVCRPNTLFRETETGDVWRLNAWTAATVTIAEWETKQVAVYPRKTFEEAVTSGQFEKIPTVFRFAEDTPE